MTCFHDDKIWPLTVAKAEMILFWLTISSFSVNTPLPWPPLHPLTFQLMCLLADISLSLNPVLHLGFKFAAIMSDKTRDPDIPYLKADQ